VLLSNFLPKKDEEGNEIPISVPVEVKAIMFLLIWIKILTYLAVFKPTRYLIKMILDIIKDISTFLIILITALVAYGQIMLTINSANSEEPLLDVEIRNSYVLSFGELGEFGDFSFI